VRYRAPGRREPAKPVASSPPVAVGSVLLASCGKCKKVTDHRVTRKVGGTPTFLECTVCADSHAYRSLIASARAKQRRAASLSSAKAVKPEDVWSRAMKGARGPAVSYSTAGRYALGQRLNHVEFGDGVVTALGSLTVCTVAFETGEKRLLMGWSPRVQEAAGS
jgi:hypothetical protein